MSPYMREICHRRVLKQLARHQKWCSKDVGCCATSMCRRRHLEGNGNTAVRVFQFLIMCVTRLVSKKILHGHTFTSASCTNNRETSQHKRDGRTSSALASQGLAHRTSALKSLTSASRRLMSHHLRSRKELFLQEKSGARRGRQVVFPCRHKQPTRGHFNRFCRSSSCCQGKSSECLAAHRNKRLQSRAR